MSKFNPEEIGMSIERKEHIQNIMIKILDNVNENGTPKQLLEEILIKLKDTDLTDFEKAIIFIGLGKSSSE